MCQYIGMMKRAALKVPVEKLAFFVMAEEFGDWLRAKREAMSLRQEDLGALLGVDRVQIHRYETGQQWPKRQAIPRIAEALGVDVNEALLAWARSGLDLPEPIRYVTDPDTVQVVEAYEGLGPPNKRIAAHVLDAMRQAEEEERKGIIGGDREASGRETEADEESGEE